MKVKFAILEPHLIEKWGENRQCPCCGAHNWSVNDRVFELSEYEPSDADTGVYVFPVIPITCTNCFNVQFLSAVALGVVEKDPPSVATSAAGDLTNE